MEKELSELRKEVVEARNLVIKTDNLLKNLHAELKVLSKRHEDMFRRTWMASAAAYVGFLILAVAVGWFSSRSSVSTERARVESAKSAQERAEKTAEEITNEISKIRKEADLQRSASERAAAALRLMNDDNTDQRLKGIDELAKLERSRLTTFEAKVLDERAKALKAELAQTFFERGRSAYRREDLRGAVKDLQRFLALDPEGPDAPAANFMLGAAFNTLKDHANAAAAFERFAPKSRGQRNADYAFALWGQSLEQIGQHDKAMEVYRRGVSEFPNSEYVTPMQTRMKVIRAALQPAEGAAAGAAQPAVAGQAAAAPQPAAAVQPPTPPAPPKPAAPAPAAAPSAAPAGAPPGPQQ